MPKFKVWLNDAGYEPMGSMALAHRREATVVEIDAETARVDQQGALVFIGETKQTVSDDGKLRWAMPGNEIECFAKGIWTRWKLVG